MTRSRRIEMVAALLAIFGIIANSQEAKKSAVLPDNQSSRVTQLCSRGGPSKIDGSWTPSKEDVEKLESDLARVAKLRSKGGIRGGQVKHPERYYRQYLGIIVGHRKLIYVNAICESEPPPSWREQLSDVCDGGCNWGVEYDVTTRTFSNLQMNGVG
jgi:hypothetical protein